MIFVSDMISDSNTSFHKVWYDIKCVKKKYSRIENYLHDVDHDDDDDGLH